MLLSERFFRLLLLSSLCLGLSQSQASLFLNGARWPSHKNGITEIKICIAPQSSVTTRSKKWYLKYLRHEANPRLEDVILALKKAVTGTWGATGSIQWADWSICTEEMKNDHVSVLLHTDTKPASFLGTAALGQTYGVTLNPWGSGFDPTSCLKYNWSSARVEYSMACIEQYGIHEFGHLLGFLHEWFHPLTSTACIQQNPGNDQSHFYVSNQMIDTQFHAHMGYTLVNPSFFDFESMMTYGSQCSRPASSQAIRFGNVTLSAADQLGLRTVYPNTSLMWITGFIHSQEDPNQCWTAEQDETGFHLLLSDCVDTDLQRWTYLVNSGEIQFQSEPSLCVTASEPLGEQKGQRMLVLAECHHSESQRFIYDQRRHVFRILNESCIQSPENQLGISGCASAQHFQWIFREN